MYRNPYEIARPYFQGEVGRSTLVNKLGITDERTLELAEALFVEHSVVNGLSRKAHTLTPAGLQQMHKEMFGELYSWAGKFRDYPTGRSLPFCLPEFIESSLKMIYDELNLSLKPNMEKTAFIQCAARFIGELNVVHPFIDGNGRTQRQTLAVIAHKAGYTLTISDQLVQKHWYPAAAEAQATASYERFEAIIASLLT